MDALALLCTLHADGPATLVRLRAADCASLEDVIAIDADQLAILLRSSRLSAGRFQKEARQLLDRLDFMVEASNAPTTSEGRTLASPSPAPTRRMRAPRSVPTPDPVPSSSASSPLDRVLSAWREADASDSLSSAGASNSAHASSTASIPIAAIDGMDADTALALARVGVRDLAALAAGDALTLARSTSLSYSKLVRLRALARRQVPLTTAPSTRVPVERLSPSDRPEAPLEPIVRLEREFVLEPAQSEEGAGGPFA